MFRLLGVVNLVLEGATRGVNMSRSHRKNFVLTDHNRGTWRYKRRANKRVRKCRDLSSGCSYKRISDSWDICDWRTRHTLSDALMAWGERTKKYELRGYPITETLTAARNEWYRNTYSK